MTKTDFIDWKRHPVTMQVYSQLYDRIEQYSEYLIESAGQDPIKDAKYSGAILAIRDILNIEPEEDQDGN